MHVKGLAYSNERCSMDISLTTTLGLEHQKTGRSELLEKYAIQRTTIFLSSDVFILMRRPTSRSCPFCLSEIIHDVLSYLVSKQRIRCIEQQIPASTTMKQSETLFHQSSACLGYSQRAVCLSKATTFHLPKIGNTCIILHPFKNLPVSHFCITSRFISLLNFCDSRK